MKSDNAASDDGSRALGLIFKVTNTSVLVPWAFLVFLPGFSTANYGLFIAYAAVLCAIYTYVVFAMKRHFPNLPEERGGGFTTFPGVVKLFKAPRAVLAGWIHFLVLDLLVGLHVLMDAQTLGIHHLLVVPCLVLTCLFAPAGLLSYLGLRLLLG